MRSSFLASVAALAAATLACSGLTFSVQEIQTGPTQTLSVHEPLPEAGQVASIHIEMGSGTLHLSGGASGLAEGTLRYNVASWAPQLLRSGADLTIRQPVSTSTVSAQGPQVVNDWDLKLGSVPMNLTIQAGAYRADLDLTALPLRALSISDGASQSEVNFGALDPESMNLFSYRTGASTVTLRNLVNADFQTMDFDGGAGDYTFDLGGQLQHPAALQIRAGVSSVRLLSPAGLNVRVTTQGALSSVQTDPGWQTDGSTYTHQGPGPLLSISVEMGIGSLSLLSR
jgi:hypothetical protein